MSSETGTEVSLVVPSFNGALRLPVLLESLARQDFPGKWEVLVCLDGSTDNSQQVLEPWTRVLPLRVLEGEPRAGVSRVLNRGYASARGEVIVRCDDYLTPRSDFSRRHREWHRDRSDRGVIGPTRDVFPDTRYAQVYGNIAGMRAVEASLKTLPEGRWVHWAANNSIHRSTWAKSGGFDETMLYGQDSEFGYRIQQLGLEVVIDMNLLADHRGPATTTQRRARRAFVSGASRRARESRHPEMTPSMQGVPSNSRQKAWRLMSQAVQRRLDSVEDAESLGAITDTAIRYLPGGVSRKVVALVVESCAGAGYACGPNDLTAFTEQKARDLAEEETVMGRDPGPQP